MRYIDAYNHFFPRRYFDALMQTPAGEKDIGKRVREVPCMHDLELRRKIVDTFDDYAQILSYSMPPLEVLATGDEVEEYARMLNDALTELLSPLSHIGSG